MTTARCRHFGICGGCDCQDLSYDEQLDRKRRHLGDLLRGVLGPDAPAVGPVVGMRPDESGWPWAFRRKAAFVFGEGGDPDLAVLGHFAAGSRRVVPIAECPVHAARANEIAFALHRHLVGGRVPAAGAALGGVLRHLLVRTTRDEREAVAMLVVTRNDKRLRAPIRAFLATEEAPDGFYLNIHERPGPFMIGPDTRRLAGRSHVRETVAGVSFLVSPTTFFQTNTEAAEALVALAVEAIGKPVRRVLDLYAGSGLFGVSLAARGHHVTMIEENTQAVRDADANVRLNRLAAGHVRLLASRVEDAFEKLPRGGFDAAILDPPRSGCPPAVLRAVFGRLRPPRVLYVSCNPETLAAELPSIAGAGYAATRVDGVDMFPHTAHVEALVTLERRGATSERRTKNRGGAWWAKGML